MEPIEAILNVFRAGSLSTAVAEVQNLLLRQSKHPAFLEQGTNVMRVFYRGVDRGLIAPQVPGELDDGSTEPRRRPRRVFPYATVAEVVASMPARQAIETVGEAGGRTITHLPRPTVDGFIQGRLITSGLDLTRADHVRQAAYESFVCGIEEPDTLPDPSRVNRGQSSGSE